MKKFLISPGYGAGWSTWNTEYTEFLLFDKGLIELAESEASTGEVDKYIKTKLGKNVYVYTGGWYNIKIVEVEDNVKIRVSEYDGNESYETLTEAENRFF